MGAGFLQNQQPLTYLDCNKKPNNTYDNYDMSHSHNKQSDIPNSNGSPRSVLEHYADESTVDKPSYEHGMTFGQNDDEDNQIVGDLLDASSHDSEEFSKDDTITMGSRTIDTGGTTVSGTIGNSTLETSFYTYTPMGAAADGSTVGSNTLGDISVLDASTVSSMGSDKLFPSYFCGIRSGGDFFQKFQEEVNSGFQDTLASINQVFHAFTLSEKDIRAVTKRIRKAKRQLGDYNQDELDRQKKSPDIAETADEEKTNEPARVQLGNEHSESEKGEIDTSAQAEKTTETRAGEATGPTTDRSSVGSDRNEPSETTQEENAPEVGDGQKMSSSIAETATEEEPNKPTEIQHGDEHSESDKGEIDTSVQPGEKMTEATTTETEIETREEETNELTTKDQSSVESESDDPSDKAQENVPEVSAEKKSSDIAETAAEEETNEPAEVQLGDEHFEYSESEEGEIDTSVQEEKTTEATTETREGETNGPTTKNMFSFEYDSDDPSI